MLCQSFEVFGIVLLNDMKVYSLKLSASGSCQKKCERFHQRHSWFTAQVLFCTAILEQMCTSPVSYARFHPVPPTWHHNISLWTMWAKIGWGFCRLFKSVLDYVAHLNKCAIWKVCDVEKKDKFIKHGCDPRNNAAFCVPANLSKLLMVVCSTISAHLILCHSGEIISFRKFF